MEIVGAVRNRKITIFDSSLAVCTRYWFFFCIKRSVLEQSRRIATTEIVNFPCKIVEDKTISIIRTFNSAYISTRNFHSSSTLAELIGTIVIGFSILISAAIRSAKKAFLFISLIRFIHTQFRC